MILTAKEIVKLSVSNAVMGFYVLYYCVKISLIGIVMEYMKQYGGSEGAAYYQGC
jgi:hypothetical protein